MNLKRILLGKLSIHYCHWHRWYTFGFERYWSGRLFYFNVSMWCIHLDCRIDWLADMVAGKPE